MDDRPAQCGQHGRTAMRRGCPTGSCGRRVGCAVSVAVTDDHVIRPIAVRCAFSPPPLRTHLVARAYASYCTPRRTSAVRRVRSSLRLISADRCDHNDQPTHFIAVPFPGPLNETRSGVFRSTGIICISQHCAAVHRQQPRRRARRNDGSRGSDTCLQACQRHRCESGPAVAFPCPFALVYKSLPFVRHVYLRVFFFCLFACYSFGQVDGSSERHSLIISSSFPRPRRATPFI